MNGPEQRDSGTKPPQPPPKDDQWLPPRLREKLEDTEKDGKKPPATAWIVGLLIVVVVVAAGWWFGHTQQVKAKARAEAAARAAAVADSIARVRTADSLAAVARADSIAAFNKLPRWKQRQIIVQQARAAGVAAPVFEEEGPFALDAGEFLFEDRARTEAEALKASTGLGVRVTRAGADGAYRIYLGRFEDRAAAEKAAINLAAKGLVKQARVVPVR